MELANPLLYDAHARPPEAIKKFFKLWQKYSLQDLDSSEDLLNNSTEFSVDEFRQCLIDIAQQQSMHTAMQDFLAQSPCRGVSNDPARPKPSLVAFEAIRLPGLFIFPSLLSPEVQVVLLNKLLHRDLSNPDHKTNIHLHYHVPYSSLGPSNGLSKDGVPHSFFATRKSLNLEPKDTVLHKSITIEQMLQRKLRWMTLGGQYDWTLKNYPSEIPPKFPSDIAHLLQGLFPEVDAQAAIVNFYSPGDTLSIHRDVSEECDQSLISISIGCDGIFIIGNEDGSQKLAIRLRSGDGILMSGQSRFAWHAVAKIVPNTCPSWLTSWPSHFDDEIYEQWRGWMLNKRINLNVRQMRNTPFDCT